MADDSIELFHVSCEKYNIGTRLKVESETPYSLKMKEEAKGWVNELLNRYKPVNVAGRDYTFYACDFIGNCAAFWGSRKCAGGQPIYYKVKMINPIKAPMCLTDLIIKEKGNENNVQKIATEYWQPTYNWEYYEYLSNEMIILEILQAPDSIAISQGKSNYSLNFDLRKKLIN